MNQYDLISNSNVEGSQKTRCSKVLYFMLTNTRKRSWCLSLTYTSLITSHSMSCLPTYAQENNRTLRNKFKSLQNRPGNQCRQAPLCLFDQTAETEETSLIPITWQERLYSLNTAGNRWLNLISPSNRRFFNSYRTCDRFHADLIDQVLMNIPQKHT